MAIHLTSRSGFRTLFLTATMILAMLGTANAAEKYTNLLPADFIDYTMSSHVPPSSTGAKAGNDQDNRAQTYFTDRTVFDVAAPGLPLEDFEGGNVVAGAVLTCTDPYDSTVTDACWTAGDILGGISIGSSSGGGMVVLGSGIVGNTTVVTGANTFTEFTYINFSPSVDSIGLDLHPDGPMTIRLYDNAGGLLDTTAGTGANDGLFWGVISTELISRIEIEGDADSGELFDDLAFGVTLPVELQSFEIE